jgi:hypothetical protein
MALTDAPARRSGGHGAELRDTIRGLMGMTKTNQTVLARAVGISQPNLSKRLDGAVPFREDDLETIADYFRLDGPGDLYDPERAWRLCRERFSRLRCITGFPGQGILFPDLIAA